MKLDDLKKIVKSHLQLDRYEHTLRVVETARELALRFNGPLKEAELAAMLHDYAKQRPKEELRRWILKSSLPKDLLDYHHELWHAPVGSILIERELGITNISVQNAVRYHTTGRAKMSQLELIVFLADYIEPGRNFPAVKEVREKAKEDLVHASLLASRNSVMYLLKKNQAIYPDSFHVYNDLTERMRELGKL